MTRVDHVEVDEAIRALPPRRRSGTRILLIMFVVSAVLAWRAVPHPVGPTRTFAKYEGKAVTTAKAAESEVEAALLVARTATSGNAFGPYTALVIADAEDGIGGLQSSFDSVQPPDSRADAVGRDLDGLLGAAVGHARDLRVAARRGRLDELRAVAAPLSADARKLEAFQGRHS